MRNAFHLPTFALAALLMPCLLGCGTAPGHDNTLVDIPSRATEQVAAEFVFFNATTSKAKPEAEEEDGFVQIFDGKTLDGWTGDPVYWRVEDGCLVGEITPETIVKRNSFIVWEGEVADFELKLLYRITKKGNSGIQYRSKMDENDAYAMVGYQADIQNGPKWTGQNYEERGRKFLAKRGESVVLETGKKPRVVEQIGDFKKLNEKVHFDDNWNEYHLVIKGNRMIHYVNGVRMSEVLDNDKENRAMKGLLGVQVHTGPPMKVEFKDIRLKVLD